MTRTTGEGPHIVWQTELWTILSHFLLSLSLFRDWQTLDLFLEFPEHFPLSADLQLADCIRAVFNITKNQIS